MQTILGAGGIIGIELANALTKYTSEIRLVARNPQKVNEGDELFKASLLDAVQVDNAVKGSDVAYLVAGLKYDAATHFPKWLHRISVLLQDTLHPIPSLHCQLARHPANWLLITHRLHSLFEGCGLPDEFRLYILSRHLPIQFR